MRNSLHWLTFRLFCLIIGQVHLLEGVSTPLDDKYTKAGIQQIEDNSKEEQKQQYAEWQVEKYERLEEYSLDEKNKKKYSTRAKEWEKVAKSSSSDILIVIEKIH